MPRTSTIATTGAVLFVAAIALQGSKVPEFHGSKVQSLKARVLFFVTSDCPISNSYTPEIRRMCDRYRTDGVHCTLVYEDVQIEDAAVRAHQAEYGTSSIHAVIDRDRHLANAAGATVTPQAIVFDGAGALRYRGRIDNRYAALGTPRQQITQRDLRDALDAVIGGQPVSLVQTEALGCFIVPSSIPRSRP